jgi:hypothetical protein
MGDRKHQRQRCPTLGVIPDSFSIVSERHQLGDGVLVSELPSEKLRSELSEKVSCATFSITDFLEFTSPFSKPIGPHNLENTHFFNAAVQCLARVVPLTAFILSPLFEQKLNFRNTKGSRGRLPTPTESSCAISARRQTRTGSITASLRHCFEVPRILELCPARLSRASLLPSGWSAEDLNQSTAGRGRVRPHAEMDSR